MPLNTPLISPISISRLLADALLARTTNWLGPILGL